MKAAAWMVLACACLWVGLSGCDRSAKEGEPQAASRASATETAGPMSSTQGASQTRPVVTISLRDWVLDPPVVEAERAAPALRLVCAAPSVTETCCALGLRGEIVGRTRFCDYPPGIENVPAIGALDETNAEVLLSLRPDLLLVSGTSRAISERLERLGLKYESVPDRSLEDIFAAITRIGAATGRPETARRLCEGMRRELKEVAQAYRGVPPARVLLLLGVLTDPPTAPFVAGPGSVYDDLLRLAGQRNVAAELGARAYGPMSLEMIVRANPDVIIELDADGKARPGGDAEALGVWRKLGPLAAVTHGRVHVLAGQYHFIPGPRIVRSFAELCKAVAERGDE